MPLSCKNMWIEPGLKQNRLSSCCRHRARNQIIRVAKAAIFSGEIPSEVLVGTAVAVSIELP